MVTPHAHSALASIPVRNHRVREAEQTAHAARMIVPLVYPLALTPLARLLGLRTERAFALEGVGLALFRRIDGAASIADHISWLATAERLSFHEARLLVMRYLDTLTKRGLIAIVVVPGPVPRNTCAPPSAHTEAPLR